MAIAIDQVSVWRLMVGIAVGLISPIALASNADDAAAFKAAYAAYQEYVASQDYQRAMPEAKTAFELGLRLYGEEHKSTAILAYNYGLTLVEVGLESESRKILRQTVELYESANGEDSVELIPVLMSLGTAVAKALRPEQQIIQYERALKLARKHYGPNSIIYGKLLLDAGVEILNKAQSPLARQYLAESYQILSAALGVEDPITGYAAFQLARFEVATNQHAEAEGFLLAALRTFEDSDRPSSNIELSTHAWLVSVYEELGEPDKATAHCQAIGRMTSRTEDQELMPLYRKEPEYPEMAVRTGREGFVNVRFTVDHEGIVRNPEVVDGKWIFRKASLEAIRSWRFAPRFVDGEPVSTPHVVIRLVFEFADP